MRQFSNSVISQVSQYGRSVSYSKGKLIHRRGDAKPGLSVVLEGLVSVGNVDMDGRYQLTAVLKTGDTFGEFTLFANLPRTHNATAFNDCKVLQLSQEQFNRWLGEHPDVAILMLSNVSQKLHSALEMLDDVKRLPTHVRLAKILLLLAVEQNTQQLPLRQSDCAELLGLTVLSTHKALNKLKAMDLIQHHYGTISIACIASLQRFVFDESNLLPIEMR